MFLSSSVKTGVSLYDRYCSCGRSMVLGYGLGALWIEGFRKLVCEQNSQRTPEKRKHFLILF